MAVPTINGSQSVFSDTTTVDPKTITLTSQAYTAGDYALLVWGMTVAQVVSAAGATNDTYAQIALFNDTAISLTMLEGTVVGGALDASIALDVSSGRRGTGGLITISGADVNASQPNAVGADTSGTTNDPSAASLTTTVNDCLVFAIISMTGSHNLPTLNAALPAGWTLLGSWATSIDQPANGAQHTLAIAHKAMPTAGATGAATWTNGMGSSQAWCGNQIAIAPAASVAASLVFPSISMSMASAMTR